MLFGKRLSPASSIEKPVFQPARSRPLWKSKKLLIPLALTMVALALALGLGLGLGLPSAAASPAPSPDPAPNAAPATAATPAKGSLPASSTWDYALGYTLTAKNANSSTYFYSTDLENTAQSDIQTLAGSGHFIACYFSAGSIESYRNDTSSIPASAIGKVMDGWPDEKWLDTRNAQVRQVMANRIKRAAAKGCQGIDADNIDGYENDTGFDLGESDAVSFLQYLADQSHALGLKFGLKNGGDLVDDVVKFCDFEINEQCVQYNECDALQPFVDAGKPVFHVEYTSSNSAKSVPAATFKKGCAPKGLSSIFKHLNLDQWTASCQ